MVSLLIVVAPVPVARLAALIFPERFCAPVVVKVIAPSAPLLPDPTSPMNVTPPVPLLIDKVSAVLVKLSMVEALCAKLTRLLVVVNVVFVPKVTAPL